MDFILYLWQLHLVWGGEKLKLESKLAGIQSSLFAHLMASLFSAPLKVLHKNAN